MAAPSGMRSSPRPLANVTWKPCSSRKFRRSVVKVGRPSQRRCGARSRCGQGYFIYQRFQRGVMCATTRAVGVQGLLLADYLKSVITNQNLPTDLAAQVKHRRVLRTVRPDQARLAGAA